MDFLFVVEPFPEFFFLISYSFFCIIVFDSPKRFVLLDHLRHEVMYVVWGHGDIIFPSEHVCKANSFVLHASDGNIRVSENTRGSYTTPCAFPGFQ